MTKKHTPDNSGERTALIAEVSQADAKRILEAFANGELEALGIVSVEQVPPESLKDGNWASRLKINETKRKR